MKRVIISILAVATILTASGRENQNTETAIRVGTFNVWGNRQRNSFTDTRNIATVRSETSGTFNGAEVSDKAPTSTIDYIYIRGNEAKYEVIEHNVLTNKYRVGDYMFYPSDHCPVDAKIRLTK